MDSTQFPKSPVVNSIVSRRHLRSNPSIITIYRFNSAEELEEHSNRGDQTDYRSRSHTSGLFSNSSQLSNPRTPI